MAISMEATPKPGVQCVWRSTGSPVSALELAHELVGPERVDEAGHVLDRDHVGAEGGEGFRLFDEITVGEDGPRAGACPLRNPARRWPRVKGGSVV